MSTTTSILIFYLLSLLAALAAGTTSETISPNPRNNLPSLLSPASEDCPDCLGMTCSGLCRGMQCMTCRCTNSCSAFCPNGDCLACCSCAKTEEVGAGDVVAVKFWQKGLVVYVVNGTRIPEDVRNMDVLHSSLRPYNQTWWQVHENGSYYETGIEIEYETEL